jgi:hypothetical protein
MTALAAARTPLADLHARFADVLPAIRATAARTFRVLRCEQDREDAVADAVLAGWRTFLRLVTEHAPVDPSALACQAVAAVARRLRRTSRLAASHAS